MADIWFMETGNLRGNCKTAREMLGNGYPEMWFFEVKCTYIIFNLSSNLKSTICNVKSDP